ncbi:MAG: sugar nucleotide-binding protein, partial [bacterium]
MRILLLGGSGRLGNAFLRCFNEGSILAPAREELDVFNLPALEKYVKDQHPDWIVNLISYNAVDKAEVDERATAFKINTELPGLIAKVAAHFDIPLIHFSTDYVFPGNKVQGYSEFDEPDPLNVYGESKYKGEIEA